MSHQPPKNTDPLPIVAGGSPNDTFVVIDKPPGLLSTPGKGAETNPAKADCVALRVQKMFPNATGPLIVHRLDMDTSGLMVLGLTPDAHRNLSRQFEQRIVTKQYVALLAGHYDHLAPDVQGTIVLPMRLDVENRPRQIVDLVQGRVAITGYAVIAREEVDGRRVTRVEFVPVTGRSHQLRVHAAHAQGLDAAIVGDPLYGDGLSTVRMMLHAEVLSFDPPGGSARIEVHCDALF